MRIGIHAAYLGRSVKTGIEVYAEQVVARMLRAGRHEFVLVGSLTREPPFAGANVRHVPIRSPGKLLPLLGEIRSIAKREAVDAFFFPTQYCSFGRNEATVSVGFDVAWRRFPDYFPPARRLAFEVLTRHMVERATRILAISDATRADLVGGFGCDPAKVRTVHLGYDEATYAPAPEPGDGAVLRARSLERGGYHLFLGTLQKRKNLINLVRAYDLARTDKPLVLAGGKGWYFDEIERAIAGMRKRGAVRLLGYVADAERAALYRGCASFLYPSLYEGFGLPVLEAMACGCKVLTSNVSSLPELVGDAGLAVDPLDVGGMARAIDSLDEARADDFGPRAVARARLFSWDKAAAATLEAIEGVGR